MPVKKINKQEILHRCWEVIHREGYHAASISALAEATGLGKPGLLHHFGSKEQLMQEVVAYACDQVRAYVIAVAQEDLPPEQRLEKLLRRQNRLAKHERRGCFFANTALETGRNEVFNTLIVQIFEEWRTAVAGLYSLAMPEPDARELAYRLQLEHEGAIIMYKLTGDTAHLEQFVVRTVDTFSRQLNSTPHHDTKVAV